MPPASQTSMITVPFGEAVSPERTERINGGSVTVGGSSISIAYDKVGYNRSADSSSRAKRPKITEQVAPLGVQGDMARLKYGWRRNNDLKERDDLSAAHGQ